jgi:hypothetical protein
MSKMQERQSNQNGKNNPNRTKTTAILSLVSTILILGLIVLPSQARATPSEDIIIIQYCVDNASRILLGDNPVVDLINSGLVSDDYVNQTCAEVKTNHEIQSSWSDTLNDLVVTPN